MLHLSNNSFNAMERTLPGKAPVSSTYDPRKATIDALCLALEEFRRLSPTMPVAQVQAFLLVALDETVSMTDVAELTGVRPSTASRYLLDLGVRRTQLDNAFGLLERGVDPMNTRRARYSLTKRGTLFVNRLIKACDKARLV